MVRKSIVKQKTPIFITSSGLLCRIPHDQTTGDIYLCWDASAPKECQIVNEYQSG